MTVRIGEIAERSGVTPRTIRYYEELGLLGPPGARSKGAHRLYGDGDVARLRELIRLRDLLGLSLEELVELAEAAQTRDCLSARWASSTDDRERVQIIEEAIPHVQRQLELARARRGNLGELESQLTAKLADLRDRLAELAAPAAPPR
jgi:DNA-binding transcriptional MerR regulator